MLIERNHPTDPTRSDRRFLLIILLLVASLCIAGWIQTLLVFRPAMQQIAADQARTSSSIDQLGRDIDALRQEVPHG